MIGDRAWRFATADQVVLGTSGPPGSTRDFERGILLTPLYDLDRWATHAEPTVEPGAVGTFRFRARAPTIPGTYRIEVRPLVEGVRWLEDEGIYLDLVVR